MQSPIATNLFLGHPMLAVSPSSSPSISPGDFFNLPFLDLHYYGHTYGSGTSVTSLGGHTPMMGSGMDLVRGSMDSAAEMARQGHALDLAPSTSTVGSTSSTMFGLRHGSGLDGFLSNSLSTNRR